MVVENMVAQMLRAAGHGLYFHEYRYCPEGSQRENSYEIDFLIVRNKKICPLEVKSSGYQTHKSFDYLVKKYQMKMEERYILYTRDLQMKDGIGFIPLYMTMCL
jgi:predicted AAA+ superfamily ATPase